MFDMMYVQGYTAALQDVKKTLEEMPDDLKRHGRRQNLKTVQAILDCMIQHRAILREDPDTFVRCNNDMPGGFEVFNERTRKPVERF